MGLGVELQDEQGETLDSTSDPKNLLGRLLPPHDDQACPFLASIDPYGDTVFNRLQMDRFLSEWVGVAAKVQTSEERALVSVIAALARRCRDEVHLYLKFIGD
jgi:hypothetical protein